MTSDSLLLVEDDQSLRELLLEELESEGYRVAVAASAEAAREWLAGNTPALVLSDLRLPGASGLSLLETLGGMEPRPAFVVITAFGTVRQAVEALKAGADDFVTKPLDMEHLLLSVARALETRRLHREVERFRSLLAESDFHGLVGSSPVMQHLFYQLRKIATADGPALVLGESGTGKELVARAIHEESPRRAGPYLAVNCSGIPGDLMESEFFGHVSGAFTGARGSRPGLFQEAHGGTLLLDEIGEMPMALQAKLLRVLQDGRIRAVGSDSESSVDVRVVAATNRNLRDAVAEGLFREDLFFRLETFSVEVPPLRERRGDVAELAGYFLARFCSRRNRGIRGFSDATLNRLAEYPFPGNVRELENAIERAVTFCEGPIIEPHDLPERIASPPPEAAAEHPEQPLEAVGLVSDSSPEKLVTMQELQQRYINHVMEFTRGNKRQAAQILGITRRTLYRWLETEEE